jgi:hypothetical protein
VGALRTRRRRTRERYTNTTRIMYTYTTVSVPTPYPRTPVTPFAHDISHVCIRVRAYTHTRARARPTERTNPRRRDECAHTRYRVCGGAKDERNYRSARRACANGAKVISGFHRRAITLGDVHARIIGEQRTVG